MEGDRLIKYLVGVRIYQAWGGGGEVSEWRGINYSLGLEQLSGGGTLGRKTRVQVVSGVAVDHHTKLVSNRRVFGHMVLELGGAKSKGN